jgi:hypothetical protein
MSTLKIESGSDGKLWVSLTRFWDEDLARLKKIPGHKWNPERKPAGQTWHGGGMNE